VKRVRQALIALIALALGLDRRPGDEERRETDPVPPADARLEIGAIVSLFAAGACGVAFVVLYAIDGLADQTQLLGLCLGLCLAFISLALILASKGLVPDEELEADYPEPEHPEEQERLERLVHESVSPVTRKKLLAGAAGAAGGGLLLAAVAPALSLGPWLDPDPLYRTPWRRGRRLVDDQGRPLRADEIEEETFYSAYPEGASRDDIAAPVVVVRLPQRALDLPPERRGWAPDGIVAFSKICTHAACAISLYRKPTFAPVQPKPALVCPCHYSTFDPARGGEVLFGPAGRPLPQLPLVVDASGELRAGGNYSAPVGPSWSGVRERGAS
jgi:ubiquinol-cytochrome c reductase iron-sulfur subunit